MKSGKVYRRKGDTGTLYYLVVSKPNSRGMTKALYSGEPDDFLDPYGNPYGFRMFGQESAKNYVEVEV